MSEELTSELKVDASIQAEEIPLTDELVVSYLQDHPEFFSKNSEFLSSVRLADPHRGSVSLVERQLQQLRNKVGNLEEEITQLMSVANHNEQLFRLYNDLYLRLIDCTSAESLLDCLHQTTTELLSLAGLKIWFSEPVELSHSSLITEDCQQIFDTRLAKDDYYFGRLQQSEQQQIFSQVTEGSVVLIKLTHNTNDIGFMAISSNDAEHFDPRMDTLLISQFRQLVAKLLFQQLFQS